MRVQDVLDDGEINKIIDTHDQLERITVAAQTVLTRRLVEALNRHAAALGEAAKASDKYANRLTWATWALVLATLGLIVATCLKG